MAGGEGTAFGKYLLLKKIATGGMGEIFLAKLKGPVGFEKLLVIKRILQHHAENKEFVDMFFAEARIAAQLTHANVVQIYEMGEIQGSFFIAMEYIHGKSLRMVLDRARELGTEIPTSHVIDIVNGLCAGLSYAHNAKDLTGKSLAVVHRDINPHNVLVSYSGEVKIIDFGIARSQISSNNTETGTIKGKFVYMSPEQSAAEELDKRSDIFSVGICLYEALTFFNPFSKANVVLSLDAIQRTDPPALRETKPKLAPLDPVVSRALAKAPDSRYPDCKELREELLSLQKSGAVARPPQSLAAFMHDLFEEQIEDEKRIILETDRAKTGVFRKIHQARREDHLSDSDRLRGGRRDWSHPGLPVPHHHSRLPFFMLASVIVMATATASYGVTLIAERNPDPAQNLGDPIASMRPAPTARSADLETKPPAAEPKPANPAPPSPRVETSPTPKSSSASNSRSASTNRKAIRPSPRPRPSRATRSPAKPPDSGGPSFGSLQMSTYPPVKITRNGTSVGQTLSRLKGSTGILVFGTGKDPSKDPFRVKVRYTIRDGRIVYSIESTPWAIVRGRGGIGLGRTPLSGVKGSSITAFEFINPKESRNLRITLRYTSR